VKKRRTIERSVYAWCWTVKNDVLLLGRFVKGVRREVGRAVVKRAVIKRKRSAFSSVLPVVTSRLLRRRRRRRRRELELSVQNRPSFLVTQQIIHFTRNDKAASSKLQHDTIVYLDLTSAIEITSSIEITSCVFDLFRRSCTYAVHIDVSLSSRTVIEVTSKSFCRIT
jgi:hypothetical protein